MSFTLREVHTLETEVCCSCAVLFAMPAEMQRRLMNDHGWFYCPNGHSQHYTGKSDAEKLREAERRLASREDDLRVARNRLDSEQASHSATRGHLTRAKKQLARVDHGVCPHCHRHFANVERHMASKHQTT